LKKVLWLNEFSGQVHSVALEIAIAHIAGEPYSAFIDPETEYNGRELGKGKKGEKMEEKETEWENRQRGKVSDTGVIL